MRHLLALLPRPSRYLGIEEGSVHTNPEAMRLHVALAFPDLYEVAMSYLGQKILYDILNQNSAWYAERVFTPCSEAIDLLRAHNAPLCTLESDTPLAKLDMIGFSVTHELCFTNLLLMLDLANIPLRQENRNETHPLIVAGGGCTIAAEPLAPFVDVMLLGEAEESLPELMLALEAAKEQALPRAEFFIKISKIPGVYVPSLYTPQNNPEEDEPLKLTFDPQNLKPIAKEPGELAGELPGETTTKATLELTAKLTAKLTAELTAEASKLHPQPCASVASRRVIANLNYTPYPERQVVPFGAVHNRLALEIARGCTRGCRFCQAGIIYRPARERSVENLQALTNHCLSATGYDDISFLSLSTGDFSALKKLFLETTDRCTQEQVSVSLPSLRVGSIDDDIMQRMAGIRRTGATLAPEAGSQRLRNVINKGITEEAILTHARKLFEHGWQQIKLYFMIGLPTETDEDLDAIVDLCCKVRDAAGRGVKRLQVTGAFSTFVPKAHTPFQWEAQIPLEEIQRKLQYLRSRFKAEKCLTMRWHEPNVSFLEGILSRGDRRLANVVESAYRKGDIFTAWLEHFSITPWLEAMQEHGLSPEEYTGPRAISKPLPWQHLQSGVSLDFLLKERKKAFNEETTPDCRYEACQACGVCDRSGKPSLLQKARPEEVISNKLNYAQRDQVEHSPELSPPTPYSASPQCSPCPPCSKMPLGQQTEQEGAAPAQNNALSKAQAPSQAHAMEGIACSNSPAQQKEQQKKQEQEQDQAQDQTAAEIAEQVAARILEQGTEQTKKQATSKHPKKNLPPSIAPELAQKAATYRIWYSKQDRAVYLSQLELQPIVERALRRARLPLSFSQGFHPLPLLTFGRALPVGVSSKAEWCAITLSVKQDPAKMLLLLKNSFPKGLELLFIEELPLQKNLPQAVKETYLLEFAENNRADQTKFWATLWQEWQAFAAESSRLWTRETKKGPRTTDLRKFLSDIQFEPDKNAILLEFDWTDKYVSPLSICLAVSPSAEILDIKLTKLSQKLDDITAKKQRALPKNVK